MEMMCELLLAIAAGGSLGSGERQWEGEDEDEEEEDEEEEGECRNGCERCMFKVSVGTLLLWRKWVRQCS